MSDLNDDNTDDDVEDSEHEVPEYRVDEQTRSLIEVALNCLVTLSEAQINEEAAESLVAIADNLAARFGIGRLDSEVHTADDGTEEIIFKPQKGLFSTDLEDDTDQDTPQ